MKNIEERLQEALKPGTTTRKVVYALAFFIVGLLFVWLGFWQTLLIAALTLIGLYIGSSENLLESVKKLVNKLFPPSKKPVTYSAEDIQKVRDAREQGKKAKAAEAADAGAKQDAAEVPQADEAAGS